MPKTNNKDMVLDMLETFDKPKPKKTKPKPKPKPKPKTKPTTPSTKTPLIVKPQDSDGETKYFDNINEVTKIIGQDDVDILTHPASTISLCGAKDSGKTYIVLVWMIYLMEKYDFVSHFALRKSKTGASRRLGQDFTNVLMELKQLGYTFKYEYRRVDNLMTKYVHKIKDENQRIEYGALDDENGVAGASAPGIIALCQIEEPTERLKKAAALIDSTNAIEDWNEKLKILRDSLKRSVRRYKKNLIKLGISIDDIDIPAFKLIFTFNDFESTHKVSIDMNWAIPEDIFWKFMFGGYSKEKLLKNKNFIDKVWDRIKASLVTNHTMIEYVEYDNRDGGYKRIDTLFVRKSKFANPDVRDIESDDHKEIMADIYDALLTGNSLELSRLLGTTFAGVQNSEFAYNFWLKPSRNAIDTLQVIKEKLASNRYYVSGFSIGWDVDVRRRFSYSTVVQVKDRADEYDDGVCYLLPQKQFRAFGAGVELNKDYVKHLNEHTLKEFEAIKTLIGKNHGIDYDSYFFIDDNVEVWMTLMDNDILNKFDSWGKATKHGSYDIYNRQVKTIAAVDSKFLLIDKSNEELIETLETIPKTPDKKIRFEKKQWEIKMDVVNSFEAGYYAFEQDIC